MQKIPWIDTTKCKKEIDCKAARLCKQGALKVQPEAEDLPGTAVDCPRVDMELCKQCGECEHACTEQAVKMLQI